MMLTTLFLLGTLLVPSKASHYDSDKTYKDDYDDVWEGEDMGQYKKESHKFVHKDVAPTELKEKNDEKEGYLKRLRRETSNVHESYDDAWMDQLPERDDEDEYADSNNYYHEQLELMDVAARQEESGMIEDVKEGVKYSLGKTLVPGDSMEVYGTYSSDTNWFSVNILDNSGNFLFHFNPRRNWGKTVMNSKNRSWNSEIHLEYPAAFKHGEQYKITILLLDNVYKIYVDDKPLSKTFPYRMPISTAKYIQLWGGSNGFTWDRIKLPGEETNAEYRKIQDFKAKIDYHGKEIANKILGKSLLQVKSYAKTTEGSLAIFQWHLLKTIQSSSEYLDLEDETTKWILSNREALETFMTSGDVTSNNFLEAVNILGELIRQDPGIKEEPLKLRLAVATALTFVFPVRPLAVPTKTIDGIAKYHTFIGWSEEEGKLFQPFFEVSAWHLRYVIGSWQETDELIWARENTPEGYDNPSKIGDATHRMVSYKLKNDDGISVHAGSPYYYYLPVTLKAIHEIGGVCGAVSKFSAGMCNAYGVPALPVGQPGHCAYIWYRNDRWQLGNDVSGWGKSNTHGGIQYTWMRPSVYFPVMDEAQKNVDSYRMSEKMRIASKLANPADRFVILEDATTECPHNFAVWYDLENAIEEPSLQKSAVLHALLPTVVAKRQDAKKISDIAVEKPITSDCFGGTSKHINDKNMGGTGYCKETTADFELDLLVPSTIQDLKFRWWGWSKPAEYDIYAMSETGEYILVKTQADERVEGWFNHWSYLSGWEMRTTKIKMDLRKGRLDPWWGTVYFGIRTFIVTGLAHDALDVVSNDKPVTTNPESVKPENLVDDNDSTVWEGESEIDWFEIDLKHICALDDIEFYWANGAQPEHVKVSYKVGSDAETITQGEDPFDKVALNMDYASKVRVELEGGDHVLSGVSACGVSYSSKDILKMKVDRHYQDYYYVRKAIEKAIEQYAYED